MTTQRQELKTRRDKEKRQLMKEMFHQMMIQVRRTSSSLEGENPTTGEAPARKTEAEHIPLEADDRVPGEEARRGMISLPDRIITLATDNICKFSKHFLNIFCIYQLLALSTPDSPGESTW